MNHLGTVGRGCLGPSWCHWLRSSGPVGCTWRGGQGAARGSCQASHRTPHPAPQPGDMRSDSLNNCTFFSCLKIHDQLISSVSNITCPDFDPSTCVQVSGPVPAGVGTLTSPRAWAPSQAVATAAGPALGPSAGTAPAALIVEAALSALGEAWAPNCLSFR